MKKVINDLGQFPRLMLSTTRGQSENDLETQIFDS